MTKTRRTHRISALLLADDDAMRGQGRSELKAALEKAGSIRLAAAELGVHERMVQRWVERAGIPKPDGRSKGITAQDLRAAIRKAKSASGAAGILGISHTSVHRLAEVHGIELPDGRVTRHR